MIYIDVDGVISDFRGWVRTKQPDFVDWDDDDAVHDIMTSNIEGVYVDAEPLPAFSYFKDLYDKSADVRFLTAVGNFWPTEKHKQHAVKNKLKWLAKMGIDLDDVTIVDKAKEKLKYCEKGSILYDDRPSTIKEWNAAGGIGFLVFDTIAGELGEW